MAVLTPVQLNQYAKEAYHFQNYHGRDRLREYTICKSSGELRFFFHPKDKESVYFSRITKVTEQAMTCVVLKSQALEFMTRVGGTIQRLSQIRGKDRVQVGFVVQGIEFYSERLVPNIVPEPLPTTIEEEEIEIMARPHCVDDEEEIAVLQGY